MKEPREVSSGGDGGSRDMQARVTRLEEWAKLSDSRSQRIEDKLDGLRETVVTGFAAMPSKADLRNIMLQAIGIMVAICGLFFTGIAWLDSRREPVSVPSPQPMIIQVPAMSAPPLSAETETKRPAR